MHSSLSLSFNVDLHLLKRISNEGGEAPRKKNGRQTWEGTSIYLFILGDFSSLRTFSVIISTRRSPLLTEVDCTVYDDGPA